METTLDAATLTELRHTAGGSYNEHLILCSSPHLVLQVLQHLAPPDDACDMGNWSAPHAGMEPQGSPDSMDAGRGSADEHGSSGADCSSSTEGELASDIAWDICMLLACSAPGRKVLNDTCAWRAVLHQVLKPTLLLAAAMLSQCSSGCSMPCGGVAHPPSSCVLQRVLHVCGPALQLVVDLLLDEAGPASDASIQEDVGQELTGAIDEVWWHTAVHLADLQTCDHLHFSQELMTAANQLAALACRLRLAAAAHQQCLPTKSVLALDGADGVHVVLNPMVQETTPPTMQHEDVSSTPGHGAQIPGLTLPPKGPSSSPQLLAGLLGIKEGGSAHQSGGLADAVALLLQHWERQPLYLAATSGSPAGCNWRSACGLDVETTLQRLLPSCRHIPTPSVAVEDALQVLRTHCRDCKGVLVPPLVGQDLNYVAVGLPAVIPGLPVVDTQMHLQQLQAGYTLVLRAMGSRWPPVAHLQSLLSACMGMSVGANLYLTPACRQGLDLHYDDHCVLVVQLQGSKLWTLLSPHPQQSLPLTYLPRTHVPHRGSSAQAGQLQVLLQPGDVLYIPRGWAHSAVAYDCGAATPLPSLHLTLGLEVDPGSSWAGLLHQAVLVAVAACQGAAASVLPEASWKVVQLVCQVAMHAWLANATQQHLFLRKACTLCSAPAVGQALQAALLEELRGSWSSSAPASQHAVSGAAGSGSADAAAGTSGLDRNVWQLLCSTTFATWDDEQVVILAVNSLQAYLCDAQKPEQAADADETSGCAVDVAGMQVMDKWLHGVQADLIQAALSFLASAQKRVSGSTCMQHLLDLLHQARSSMATQEVGTAAAEQWVQEACRRASCRWQVTAAMLALHGQMGSHRKSSLPCT